MSNINSTVNILIIDDDSFQVSLMTDMLNIKNYVIYTAEDGAEAEKLCREITPHLVITDLLMPNQDGIETIIQLRKNNAKLPIIAMSGGDDDDHTLLKTAKILGANNVFQKPVQIEKLLSAIDSLLEKNIPVSSSDN